MFLDEFLKYSSHYRKGIKSISFRSSVPKIEKNSYTLQLKEFHGNYELFFNSKGMLTLASWYSVAKPSKNADSVFSKIGDNSLLNDLKVVCWQDEESLIKNLNQELILELKLKDEKDCLYQVISRIGRRNWSFTNRMVLS